MRIGIDYRAVTAAPVSGIARQVCALEAVLRRDVGADVRLYSSGPLDHPHRAFASFAAGDVATSSLHRPLQRWRFEGRHLSRMLREAKLDIYVATINMGLPARRRGMKTRLVLMLHDTFQITHYNRHRSRLHQWLYRATDYLSIRHSVRVADAIWVPSGYVAARLAALFPDAGTRIQVLPNAVTNAVWNEGDEPPAIELPKDYWLVVGTRETRKNVPWFVEQWQQAGGAAVLPALVLVGHPIDLPPQLASLEGVHFVNDLTDAGLASLYRGARRLWQPSYAEGFGLPVVEAAVCGTPVATALGSSLDEITPNGAPRFDTRDGDGLQALMRRVATAPARGPGESVEELQAWGRRYDLPAYAKHVERLIGALTS